MSRFGYNIRQSFSQMNRNKGMYFTSTMAITAMMLILGLFFVTFVNVSLFTANIEKDYNVIQVYMKEGNKQEVTQEAGAALEAMDGVDHITYVSKDEALSTLKTRWGDNGYLLENLPENPLPDSYNVYVKDKNAANAVAEAALKDLKDKQDENPNLKISDGELEACGSMPTTDGEEPPTLPEKKEEDEDEE